MTGFYRKWPQFNAYSIGQSWLHWVVGKLKWAVSRINLNWATVNVITIIYFLFPIKYELTKINVCIMFYGDETYNFPG